MISSFQCITDLVMLYQSVLSWRCPQLRWVLDWLSAMWWLAAEAPLQSHAAAPPWPTRTYRYHYNDVIMSTIANHQPRHCLLNHLFGRRSKKTSKLRVTGLCVGNSPETGEFPAQMASNAENVSIWWRHNVLKLCVPKFNRYLFLVTLNLCGEIYSYFLWIVNTEMPAVKIFHHGRLEYDYHIYFRTP